ncbi:MAG: adenosine kinase [Bdellovibrionales bacterium]|nr:adenosine kinase [Bdellovibrionales bacterium]
MDSTVLNPKFDVYGIGNAIMDLQLKVAEDDLERFELEKGAMRLVDVDQQQRLIEYFHGQALNQASGGSAANTMIALSQLGGRAAYGCLVGDDAFGKFYFSEMRDLAVELHTKPVQGKVTGTCVILVTPDAERTMNTHLGASADLSASDVSEELISQSKWLYVEGYLFTSEGGQGAVRRAVSLAKKHNVRVAVTFSDGFIVDVFGEPLRETVRQADLVFANLNEAQRYTGITDENKAFLALCDEAANVVMTMSERGARVRYDGQTEFIEATPVQAEDDTGAGDMFAGGFLYGVTHGLDGRQAGSLACFLAGKVVSQMGPRLQCDVRKLVEGQSFLPAMR